MYAVVLLPEFELQCALRAKPADEWAAVALIADPSERAGAAWIKQVNGIARTEGVAEGMSLPQGQARCAELVFRRASACQEKVASAVLLQAAERVSPYLEHTGAGCCTVDLRRHGELDHAAWSKELVDELVACGLHARVGIAATPDAAIQAARLAQPVLCAADAFQSLDRLPIPVLEPSTATLSILADWGIERVADLRALDRQQVGERLGTEGLELWDRAAGGTLRPLRLVRATQAYEELVEFEGGGVETVEPILFRLRRCLEQVTRRLQADFLLAGEITLSLDVEGRPSVARTIHLPSPTCAVEVLFRVLSTYLETVQTEQRISGFRVQAFPSTPRDHQAHLWEASLRDPNGFSETLARLAGVVGAEHVGSPRRLPSHRPDRCRLEEPRFDHSKDRTSQRKRQPALAGTTDSMTFPPLGPSLRRYRPAWRISVESVQERPVHLRGGNVQGAIRACAGPWRLDGDWWDHAAAWRWEEWDVEMDRGGLYRVASHRQANWWMLGLYD